MVTALVAAHPAIDKANRMPAVSRPEAAAREASSMIRFLWFVFMASLGLGPRPAPNLRIWFGVTQALFFAARAACTVAEISA